MRCESASWGCGLWEGGREVMIGMVGVVMVMRMNEREVRGGRGIEEEKRVFARWRLVRRRRTYTHFDLDPLTNKVRPTHFGPPPSSESHPLRPFSSPPPPDPAPIVIPGGSKGKSPKSSICSSIISKGIRNFAFGDEGVMGRRFVSRNERIAVS